MIIQFLSYNTTKAYAASNENRGTKNTSITNIETSKIDELTTSEDEVTSITEVTSQITTTSTQVETTTEEITEPVVEEDEVVKEISSNKNSEFTIASGASSFKSYMNYRCITNRSSLQYKMQQQAYTDENGLRKIGEYYCVAMGTYYGNLGDKLYVETDEGASWKVILADIKSDSHTDSTHRYTLANRCMMEFIVETESMPSSIRSSGTVNGLGFQGKINYIEKIS